MGPLLLSVRLQPDPYYIFLVLVLGGLAVMTIGMAVIAVWLFRRNRRVPRLVKGRRIR
jgi:hypothetical protein